jgi:hypothetical protein
MNELDLLQGGQQGFAIVGRGYRNVHRPELSTDTSGTQSRDIRMHFWLRHADIDLIKRRLSHFAQPPR